MYPETKCDSKDRAWNCDDADCPEPELTVEEEGACPVVINNQHPDCPATNPSSGGAVCESAALLRLVAVNIEFCSCFGVGDGFGCGSTDRCEIASYLEETTPPPDEELTPPIANSCPCVNTNSPDCLATNPLFSGATCQAVAMERRLGTSHVSCIPEGSPVTADFSSSRVRLFFDPATGLVSGPPTVG